MAAVSMQATPKRVVCGHGMGCRQQDTCRFEHIECCAFYLQNALFPTKPGCKHGDKCTFKHADLSMYANVKSANKVDKKEQAEQVGAKFTKKRVDGGKPSVGMRGRHAKPWTCGLDEVKLTEVIAKMFIDQTDEARNQLAKQQKIAEKMRADCVAKLATIDAQLAKIRKVTERDALYAAYLAADRGSSGRSDEHDAEESDEYDDDI